MDETYGPSVFRKFTSEYLVKIGVSAALVSAASKARWASDARRLTELCLCERRLRDLGLGVRRALLGSGGLRLAGVACE